MKDIGGRAEKFANNIRNNNLYRQLPSEILLDATQFQDKDPDFFKKVQVNDNIVSDNLSKLLGVELGLDEYAIICDIITSRKPKTIHLEKKRGEKENEQLEDRSPVVQSIGLRSVLRIYCDRPVAQKFTDEQTEEKLKGLIQSSSDELFASKH